MVEVVERAGRQLVAIALQVAADKVARFVLRGRRPGPSDVADVVVPVEEGLPTGFQLVEECLLDGVEDVEAYEDVGGVGGKLLALDGVALKGAFVEEAVGTQVLAEVVVDVAHAVPEVQEALLQLGVGFDGEVAEESAQGLLLLGSDIGVVVELAQVVDVGKEAAGVGHVLVDVVEVGQHHLAPGIELVHGLRVADAPGIGLIEAANALNGVAERIGRRLLEEFADGLVAGCPDGCR